MPICPVCKKHVSNDPDKHMTHPLSGEIEHHCCAMKESGEYEAINALFERQDDWKVDPTTAMADLIGQLGHFAEGYSHRKRGHARINFEDAVRRGLNYWRDER